MKIKTNRSLLQRWADVPLRAKMTGVTVLILSLGLLVAGVGTMSLLKPSLYANQDTELRAISNNPVSALQPGAQQDQITRNDVIYAPGRNYVAMFDAEGDFLYDNRNSEAAVLPEIEHLEIDDLQIEAVSPGGHGLGGGFPQGNDNDLDIEESPSEIDQIVHFTDDDGVVWRGVVVPVYGSAFGNIDGYLLVAGSTELIEQVAAQYIGIFAGFGIAVILLGAALTRIFVSAAFEPLTEVERTAREIARGDYSKRIHVASPNTEVGHVGTSLNVMLDQINNAFNERAETIDKMRRFVGDAGHELRTPLVSLRGYAEMYRMGMLQETEHIEQAMDRIEKEAIRMTSLVEDLLNLARLDAKRELELKPLDLNRFARDAAFDGMAQAPNRVITAIECPHNPRALGDEHKIRQVMTNLIGNALRHTNEGTPIEVFVTCSREHAVFEIRDHGDGVPEQIRDKIFDRFWRADTSRNRETGGSGLGLSIVRSIVDAHNGTVRCIETEGGGATFRVELPLAEPILGLETSESGLDAATVFEQSRSAQAAGAAAKGTAKTGRVRRIGRRVRRDAGSTSAD
ncbi:sensor histidine kinase [Canibacter zhoujuaniae]|uniref:sensor histidine kinase n=1 Tax=Canibacter zhoujuaniae TaxID=2708343 RepID=UPI00142221EA|nr:HAMP domain-containing sensor histidine kinase [Canibacter zhoujuaniae]